MGFLDLIGDVVSLPGSIVKDVVGAKPRRGGTNTGESLENIVDDMFGWME